MDGLMNQMEKWRTYLSATAVVVFLAALGLMLVLSVSQARAESGFLGLEVQGINPKLAKVLDKGRSAGVLVKDVAVGEAGALAGFRRGDLIIKFARSRVRSFDDLLQSVVKTKPHNKIAVEVIRDGRTKILMLKLGKRPASWKVQKAAFHNYSDIGFTVVAINAKVKKRFSLPWGSVGLVVTLVDPESGKVATGLNAGDIIVQANLKDVWHPDHLTRIIFEARNRKKSSILILIQSAKGFRYSLLPINKKK